jgi:hypothetical protein
MITVQQLRRAKGIEGYYASALSEGASEYYTSQRGVWYGRGAERIQLPGEVTKEDLIAVCNNEVPKTRERLTARTNDVRHEPVIDPETGEVKMREVSNRRIAVDLRFTNFGARIISSYPDGKPGTRKLLGTPRAALI